MRKPTVSLSTRGARLSFIIIAVAWQGALGAKLAPEGGRLLGDSDEYLHLASNMVAGDGYCYDAETLSIAASEDRLQSISATHQSGLLRWNTDPSLELPSMGDCQPTAMRQPAYPAFLAILLTAAGYRPVFLFVAQALLLALALLFIRDIAVELFRSEWIGWGALAAGSFFPPLVVSSSLVMSDALFVFLLMLALRLIVMPPSNVRNTIFAGIVFAAAGLTKPLGLIAFPVELLLLILVLHRNSTGSLRRILLLTVAFMLPVAGWTLRNGLVLDHWSPLSGEGGFNLWLGTYDPVHPWAIVHLPVDRSLAEEIYGSQYYITLPAGRALASRAVERIQREPRRFVLIGIARMMRVGILDFPGGRSWLGPRSPELYRLTQLLWFAVWCLFFIGVTGGRRRFGPRTNFLLLVPLVIFPMSFISWVPPRTFLPFYPLLFIGASAGSYMGLQWVTRRNCLGSD